jgi:nitrate reductase gamma subunit
MPLPWPTRHVTLHFGGAVAAVATVCLIPTVGALALGTNWSVGICVLFAAAGIFLLGLLGKVARWMRSPVPFCIPLIAGQHRTVPTLARDRFGSPHSVVEVMLRVLRDVLLFRPLLRTTPTARQLGRLSGYGGCWLWFFAVAFHGSLAIVLLRHLRLFLTPVPGFVTFLEQADSVTDLWVPRVHATSLLLLVALGLLIGRRLVLARLRYISLAADYFPLLLLIAIACTGLLMRHVTGTDVAGLKIALTGLATGASAVPARVDALLSVHLFLVSILIAYFPLSKLMHMPGALMSPTLTLMNNSREVRHINVCNPTVQTRHYAEYESEFRERMIEAGLPVEES